VVVAEVDPTSPARDAGIARGFRIERINGKEIRSPADVQSIAESLRPGSTVSVVGSAPEVGQSILNYRLRN